MRWSIFSLNYKTRASFQVCTKSFTVQLFMHILKISREKQNFEPNYANTLKQKIVFVSCEFDETNLF